MLKLNEFSHNYHLSKVKMLAINIRRGISVLYGCLSAKGKVESAAARLSS